MKVNLYFPWRMTQDRLEAFLATLEFVPKMYPFDGVFSVDSGHPRFNRCGTRNLAMQHALDHKVDVAVVCDADSIPEEKTLREAIENASDGRMHFPFDIAWYVERKAIYKLRQGCNLDQIKSRIIDKCLSEGGAYVCQPSAWFKAGGMDEGLIGWGCDDRSFLAASRTILGMPVKHEGVLLCLPHYRPSDVGEPVWHPEDVDIMIQYQDAYMNPEKMQEVIDERRAYLSSPEQAAAQERRATIRVFSPNLHGQYEAGDDS